MLPSNLACIGTFIYSFECVDVHSLEPARLMSSVSRVGRMLFIRGPALDRQNGVVACGSCEDQDKVATIYARKRYHRRPQRLMRNDENTYNLHSTDMGRNRIRLARRALL